MSLRKHFTGDTAVADALNSEWAQNGYRSEDDARQVASLVQDLIDNRCHVALSCRDADTLDHYSRLLVRDLRQRDSVKVVPYFPSSTEVLLSRLNELLARVTIEQAMRREHHQERDIHVFVLHDTPSLANAELTLLVQLINDLPGTQLRLVLVLDSDDHDHARLPLLGQRARHWDVPVSAEAATLPSRDGRTKPSHVPVLNDAWHSTAPTDAHKDEPVKPRWWQRLARIPTRQVATAMVAACVLSLGATLGWSPSATDTPKAAHWQAGTVIASTASESAGSPVPREEAVAMTVPAWLSARCGASARHGDTVCAAAATPS